MQYTLRKGALEAVFSDAGAELVSLKKKGHGPETAQEREYIWNADPAFWGRHTPVLFPFVGQVKGKVYRWRGEEYTMGQHGFARDRVFTLKE